MRIALCISGQIRNSAQTLPRLSEFARSISADVFVSTWRSPGSKVSGIQGIWHIERIFGAAFSSFLPDWMLGERGVVGALPNFEPAFNAGLQETLKPVTTEMLLALFPNARIDIEDSGVLDLDLISASSDNNSLRMLYKIWRCNELRR